METKTRNQSIIGISLLPQNVDLKIYFITANITSIGLLNVPLWLILYLNENFLKIRSKI